MNHWLLVCFHIPSFLFSVAKVLAGLRKQLINNSVFPIWASAAGFDNIDNNNNDNNNNK